MARSSSNAGERPGDDRAPRLGRSPWAHLARVLATAALFLGLLPGAALAAPSGPRVHPELLQQVQADPERIVRVIVSRQGSAHGADDYVAQLGDAKFSEVGDLGFAALVKAKDLDQIGRHPGVKYVSPDAQLLSTDTVDSSKLAALAGQVSYDKAVGADQVWATGVSGNGIGVAVIDSGVNPTQQDFNDRTGHTRVVQKMKLDSNLQPTQGDDADRYGHGTLVAGIVLGNSWNASNADRGKYVGIAPDANLIDFRTADDKGVSYVSGVVNALTWVIQNRQTYNIRVVNLSMVSTVSESAATSVLDAAVELAWLNGIFVVTAAGNSGAGTMLYPPANDPFVLTVGAADTMGTAGQGDDTLAPWSSYGTTQDGYAKPDLVAPGRYLTSVFAYPDSTLEMMFPQRIIDQRYFWASGTSLAAPVVSGIAALAFAQNPRLSNDELKWLLLHTATPLASPGAGQGEVSAAALFAYGGAVEVANQNLPISTQLVGPGGATTYPGTASWSTSSWKTSTWTSSTWKTSTWTTSSWKTSTWTTSSWKTTPATTTSTSSTWSTSQVQ